MTDLSRQLSAALLAAYDFSAVSSPGDSRQALKWRRVIIPTDVCGSRCCVCGACLNPTLGLCLAQQQIRSSCYAKLDVTWGRHKARLPSDAPATSRRHRVGDRATPSPIPSAACPASYQDVERATTYALVAVTALGSS